MIQKHGAAQTVVNIMAVAAVIGLTVLTGTVAMVATVAIKSAKNCRFYSNIKDFSIKICFCLFFFVTLHGFSYVWCLAPRMRNVDIENLCSSRILY